MSVQRFTLILEVDDDALAASDHHDSPPPLDFDIWEWSDLPAAVEKGICSWYGRTALQYEGPGTEEDLG